MFLQFIQILSTTILLGLNRQTVFAADLLQRSGGSKKSRTFKMEVFAAIANG